MLLVLPWTLDGKSGDARVLSTRLLSDIPLQYSIVSPVVAQLPLSYCSPDRCGAPPSACLTATKQLDNRPGNILPLPTPSIQDMLT